MRDQNNNNNNKKDVDVITINSVDIHATNGRVIINLLSFDIIQQHHLHEHLNQIQCIAIIYQQHHSRQELFLIVHCLTRLSFRLHHGLEIKPNFISESDALHCYVLSLSEFMIKII